MKSKRTSTSQSIGHLEVTLDGENRDSKEFQDIYKNLGDSGRKNFRKVREKIVKTLGLKVKNQIALAEDLYELREAFTGRSKFNQKNRACSCLAQYVQDEFGIKRSNFGNYLKVAENKWLHKPLVEELVTNKKGENVTKYHSLAFTNLVLLTQIDKSTWDSWEGKENLHKKTCAEFKKWFYSKLNKPQKATTQKKNIDTMKVLGLIDRKFTDIANSNIEISQDNFQTCSRIVSHLEDLQQKLDAYTKLKSVS